MRSKIFFQQSSMRRFRPIIGPMLRLQTSEKDYLEFALFVSVGTVVLLVSSFL